MVYVTPMSMNASVSASEAVKPHKQNPPVLTWRCQLIQVHLYRGHRMAVYVCSIHRESKKNPDPYDFLARLHQKSTDVCNFWQRQFHFIRSSAFASNKFNAVDNHLQFSWRMGAADWLSTGNCRQSDRPVEKTTPGLYEGQRRTLWTLAVIGCSLLCAA